MIRINLLPQEEKAHRQVSFNFKAGEILIPVAVVAAVALVLGGTAMSQQVSVASLQKSITDVEEQSRALGPQIERVNRLAREKAELDLRLGIISKLESGRTSSVRLMDELARCVPDHLWLTTAQQVSPTQVSVEGVTYSNLVISDFMSSLERSPMFANVEVTLAQRSESSTGSTVKFRINCQVTPDAPVN